MILNREEIETLIKEKELFSGFIDLKTQLTPNGFDLTVNSVSEFKEEGALDFSNKERKLPAVEDIPVTKENPEDKFGWWDLKKGVYKVKTNETVNIPKDLIAIAYPRSSLLRMGVFTQNAVWDAGFKGRSEFILVVDNPQGLKLKQNARVVQLVFVRINETKEGYNGIFQE